METQREERRPFFAFHVGGNLKWVPCLPRLLEADFGRKNTVQHAFLAMGHRMAILLEIALGI